MTEEEAKLFAFVLENKEMFVTLIKSGALNQKNASVSLNFDNSGILQTITRNDSLYKRKYDLLVNNNML